MISKCDWGITKMKAVIDSLSYPVWHSLREATSGTKHFLETYTPLDDVTSASDLQLAQAAARFDTSAFEVIYNRHHRRVYSICLRMLHNATEAEDLTQDAFFQLYRKVGTFRGDSAFTTWLHRLTVNQVLMHFRKRNVKLETTTKEGDTPVQIVSGTGDPKKMRIVDKISLDDAVAQLSEGYRKVFVLHDVEGYEHEA